MELEKELKAYKSHCTISAREEKVWETIQKSQEAFVLSEKEQSISHLDFMLGQFRMMRKRWWLLQALMLGLVSGMLPYMQDQVYMMRILGVAGVLFVVLVIPEFWKNETYACMQVEGTCLYSLRQIYAARFIWFGMIDMFILIGFWMIVGGNSGLAAIEVFVQFLFPMLVAACICFGILCRKTLINETTAILFCLLWSAVWCFIILNEAVFKAITFPVWGVLFGFFLCFLARAVYKTVYDCNGVWEVNLGGITAG